MFNLKVSGIIAGIAFVLSFLIGLFSKTTMPMIILRPLIFAFVFFVISALIYILIRTFLPELLEDESSGFDPGLLPGSRINITEGDAPDFVQGFSPALNRGDSFQDDAGGVAPGGQQDSSRGTGAPPQRQVFMGAQADDSEDGLGNIGDLMGKYTVSQSSPPAASFQSETLDQNAQEDYTKAGDLEEIPKPAGIPGSVDILPDLESMAGAFMPATMGRETDTTDYSVSAPPRKPMPGRKTKEWAGDFNAKDMASGLRTILNKEKEG